jgi:hypothetical protein
MEDDQDEVEDDIEVEILDLDQEDDLLDLLQEIQVQEVDINEKEVKNKKITQS